MISYLFGFFIIIGIIYSFFNGNISLVNESLLLSGSDAVTMIIKLIPLLCLWLGVMKIAETSGLVDRLSLKLSVIIKPIFPELSIYNRINLQLKA